MTRKIFKYNSDFTFINSTIESIDLMYPSLHLGNLTYINIYSLWRLSKRDRILVDSVDYHDLETRSKCRGLFYQILLKKKLLDLNIYDNGDMILKFDKDLCLEVYPDLMTETNWDITWITPGGIREIQCLPGGEVKLNESDALSNDILSNQN